MKSVSIRRKWTAEFRFEKKNSKVVAVSEASQWTAENRSSFLRRHPLALPGVQPHPSEAYSHTLVNLLDWFRSRPPLALSSGPLVTQSEYQWYSELRGLCCALVYTCRGQHLAWQLYKQHHCLVLVQQALLKKSSEHLISTTLLCDGRSG